MLPINASEEYLRAVHLGQKEKKKLEAAGKDPYPPSLEEICPEALSMPVHELPVQEIPIDRIAGTASKSRTNVFSASFLPLPDPDSEFAVKWTALCRAHLSDTGIRDPIECYEYLGDFYVIEGNKRASVLRYFGALRVPAKIKRILLQENGNPRSAAYAAFLAFHRDSGLYDVQFRDPADYARLCAAIGIKPGEEWTDVERSRFSACFTRFKDAFSLIGDRTEDVLPEDALLLFLGVYSYEQLDGMTQSELRKALQTLWGDVRASSAPEEITVKTAPNEGEKSPIGKLISGVPRHLNVAFVFTGDPSFSLWTCGHEQGAREMEEALGSSVCVRRYFRADSREAADALLDKAVSDGADVVFTTTPPLLQATLKAAVRYPKTGFFNCSACKPLASVRSYYCRTYEGKFITGLIAGALSKDRPVGYIGSYPILGVPAAINAFALGVRMTNPSAKVLLEWSCLPGDPVAALRARGARVISNRDIPLPDARYMAHGEYGTVLFEDDGAVQPLASPCWMWGKLYEKIVRAILSGKMEKKERAGAVNYWLGMDSGVIDVVTSEALPAGVRVLAEHFSSCLRDGTFDPFLQKLGDAGGGVICDGARKLTSMELLQMDRLAEHVEGRIPEYEELLPMSKSLVRALYLPGRGVPPETEEEP